ncbi:hypothetical protein LZF95_16550 [Algoriphagus sp. AGSA1]|uniref:hypothetical protein n=1 Tax=unclassified Algoriphagus TaxID=2641541 RepID=UPI00177AD475|nr:MULTISPECIES: hypothetical protein [unclassified Algoriphagus]MCE7056294.1 hypothetical protein [Algoriphagus sp. AGSA1]
MVTYRSLILTGLIFGMFQFGGLAQSQDSLAVSVLTGVWLMDSEFQMEKSALAGRNSLNSLKEEHLQSQLESMSSRIYIFHEGGRFEASWNSHGDTQLVYGTWNIRKDGILEIQLDDKWMLSYSVTLDKRGLQLSLDNPKETEAPGLYLKRVEP